MNILNNYACMRSFDADNEADWNYETMEPVCAFQEQIKGSVLMGETTHIGGYPYIVTQEIEQVSEDGVVIEEADSLVEPTTWKLGKVSKAYEEFLRAREKGFPVLNVPFKVKVDFEKGLMKEYGYPDCVVYIQNPDKAAKMPGKEDWISFNYLTVVGQYGNWVILESGKIGYINWMCMTQKSYQELECLGRCSKYSRYGNEKVDEMGWAPLTSFNYFCDAMGWKLCCPQYKSFDDLLKATEEWGYEE